MTLLRTAAVVEVASLLVLLVNLATAHVAVLASAVGPIHGTAYLVVIAATALRPGAPRAARWWSVLPGFGGWIALRLLVGEDADDGAPVRESGGS